MHTSTTTTYPHIWEQAWIDWVVKHTATGKTDTIEAILDRLIKPTAELSNLFTKERPKQFENYYKRPEYVHAYGLYYFPQSFTRARLPIAEVINFRNWKFSKSESFKILDLGCGSGAASLGILDLLHAQSPKPEAVEIHGLDYAPQALEAFQSLFKTIYIDQLSYKLYTYVAQLEHYAQAVQCVAGSFDLIVLSFAFNEVFSEKTLQKKAQWIQVLGTYLKPTGLILIIEPALKQTSSVLYTLSELLITSKQLYNWGPYWNDCSCPFYKMGRSWSHEVVAWNPPASLQYLNRTLFRTVQELKFSYALLGLQPCDTSHLGAHVIRLTSPFSLEKGCFRFNGVNSQGQWFRFELMTRALEKYTLERLNQIQRGTLLSIIEPKPLGSSGIDFRISNHTDLHILYAPP